MSVNNYGSGSRHIVKKAFFASTLAISSGTTFAGSGGNSANYLSFEGHQGATSIFMIVNSRKNENKHSNKVTQQLNFIKSTFDLTDEELSKACNVSARKTISNWKENGEIPRDNNRQRVFELFLLAKDWNEQNLPKDKVYIKKDVLNGYSVFDILLENSLDSQKALFAGRRLLRHTLKSNSIELV